MATLNLMQSTAPKCVLIHLREPVNGFDACYTLPSLAKLDRVLATNERGAAIYGPDGIVYIDRANVASIEGLPVESVAPRVTPVAPVASKPMPVAMPATVSDAPIEAAVALGLRLAEARRLREKVRQAYPNLTVEGEIVAAMLRAR